MCSQGKPGGRCEGKDLSGQRQVGICWGLVIEGLRGSYCSLKGWGQCYIKTEGENVNNILECINRSAI